MDASRSETAGPIADWAGIVCASILLCWPVALNGYPLVFADTANYLGQALLHFLGWNAPPFYSFFLLATHLGLTLFLPVIAQGLIAAHLVWRVLREFGWRGPWPVLCACLLLSAATSLPWFVSLLTADVFTGLLVLALWLLAFGRLGRWERIYLSLLAVGATAVHLSHLPLAIVLAVLGGGAAIWAGRRAGIAVFGRLALVPAAAAAMLVSVNLIAHGSASLAPYGSVVLAARMLGDGTARDYLREACPTRRFQICPYLDQIGEGGSDFLWQRPVLDQHLGGGKAWAPEAKEIVHGTIAFAPFRVAEVALVNAVRQFGHLWLNEPLRPWLDAPGPDALISRFFPGELAAFRGSAQVTGKLPGRAVVLAPVQLALAWAGLVALAALTLSGRRTLGPWALCLFSLAAVLVNALVTAGLSGVEDRYEARIAWLMAFAPAVVLAADRRAGRRAAAFSASSAAELGTARRR
jgi:hypothetical protein